MFVIGINEANLIYRLVNFAFRRIRKLSCIAQNLDAQITYTKIHMLLYRRLLISRLLFVFGFRLSTLPRVGLLSLTMYSMIEFLSD